jgi:phage/plasmid-associated DNA primase
MSVDKALKDSGAVKKKVERHQTTEEYGGEIERALRILTALGNFDQYFDSKATSICADRLSARGHFFAVEAPEADVGRLSLYAYNGMYYSRNGAQVVAKELERIRFGMLAAVDRVHSHYDRVLKKAMEDRGDDKLLKKMALAALGTIPKCEIKNTFRQEVCITLAARNITKPEELNKPPDGYLFAVALKNGLLLGKGNNGKLELELRDFSPEVKITRQFNVVLGTDSFKEAEMWYNFTRNTLGGTGAFQFYEHAGYMLVTTYPLPTERTLHVIVGDPNTGKGTHISAFESILRNGGDVFFSNATPHKLTDPREHFSRQNLSNKMAIIHGDIPHSAIGDYSEVNALLGGESSEMEKKFRDPTVETPTFKVIWASATPLHKIKQPGGAFRRILLNETMPVGKEDSTLKPKMLAPEALDGFFLNMLTGLARLYSSGWRYTNEPSTADVEAKWTYLADSVGIFISENLTPSSNPIAISDVYGEYEQWCKTKQISPVTEKTFATRLKNYGKEEPIFRVEKVTVNGKRPYHVFADLTDGSMDEKKNNDDPKNDMDTLLFSWEAFVSAFPEITKTLSISHGQVTRMREEKKEDDIHVRACIDCPNDVDTPQNVSAQRENKAPPENKKVSTSFSGESGNPGEHDHHKGDILNANPVKSDTGNKTGDNASPITLDNKKSLKTHDPGHAAELNADPVNSDVQNENYSMTEKTKMRDSDHAAESTADPVKSNAQSEIHSITEEDGKLIMDQLLSLGYHVDPGSGPTIDMKNYKLGIHGIERLPEDSRERFLRIMENEHFEKNNRGIYNVTWFVRPLAKTSKGGEAA